jgi:ribulose-5-phosphate 4-epimerase/fuculose-1-phosphate aldolase
MIDELKQQIVEACHILAATECVREIVGHVSVRLPGTDEMLVRCRRPDDPGVEFTELVDIKRVAFDGTSSELTGGYMLQGEFSIHSEIYRKRPDVNAIVHGHPRASLLCGILDLPFDPIVGAYDTWALEVTLKGVSVFPRGILISTPELGQELADLMGDADVVLLQGHGVVTVGPDVPVAVVRAIKLETMAEILMQAYTAGGPPKVLSNEDVVEKMDHWRPNAPTYARWIWDFYRRKLGFIPTPSS